METVDQRIAKGSATRTFVSEIVGEEQVALVVTADRFRVAARACEHSASPIWPLRSALRDLASSSPICPASGSVGVAGSGAVAGPGSDL